MPSSSTPNSPSRLNRVIVETPANHNSNKNKSFLDTPFIEQVPQQRQPSSPPLRSPIKTIGMSTPLPPIQAGSLRISKRKRLEPSSSPVAIDDSTVNLENADQQQDAHKFNPIMKTPSKLRSFSSPIRPISKRTPSLQDSPIPVLSPPSPPLGSITADLSDASSLLVQISSTSSSSSSVAGSPGFSTTSVMLASSLSPGKRRVTSPLASKFRGGPRAQELSRVEFNLDRDILKWQRLLDRARRAQKYTIDSDNDKTKPDQDLNILTQQWRDAGQKAATYLLNQAGERVSRMGGMEVYVNRQKERNQSCQGYDNDKYEVDYESLTTEEKERFDELKEEYEDEVKKKRQQEVEEEEEIPTEVTMKYMLKSLNIDMELLYPDGIES